MNSKLLEFRNKMKKKKPHFLRTDGYLMDKQGWRKPIGMHNKRRLKRGGHQKCPSIGYSSPKAVRGLNKLGLKPILVCTLSDLNKITEEDSIVLSSKLGLKKKLELLDEIKKRNLNLSNVKDIDNFVKNAKEIQEKKKTEKKKKKEKRESSKKESEKKKDEKKKTEDKQKDLSKEAKVENKSQDFTGVKEKQAPTQRVTAPKSV